MYQLLKKKYHNNDRFERLEKLVDSLQTELRKSQQETVEMVEKLFNSLQSEQRKSQQETEERVKKREVQKKPAEVQKTSAEVQKTLAEANTQETIASATPTTRTLESLRYETMILFFLIYFDV
jgi:peptidoglycan hydrolase CwlO-like protein